MYNREKRPGVELMHDEVEEKLIKVVLAGCGGIGKVRMFLLNRKGTRATGTAGDRPVEDGARGDEGVDERDQCTDRVSVTRNLK